jgi:hypothetical protein
MSSLYDILISLILNIQEELKPEYMLTNYKKRGEGNDKIWNAGYFIY